MLSKVSLLTNAGQADNHEMRVRPTRDLPSHFGFAESVGAQKDLCDFCGTLSRTQRYLAMIESR
jgi:hypothetical protein